MFNLIDTTLTLREISSRTGLSIGYLSQIRNGKANPTLKVADKLGLLLHKEESHPVSDSLQLFLDTYSVEYPELKEVEWVAMLANIKLRGRTPKRNEDYLILFLMFRSVFR